MTAIKERRYNRQGKVRKTADELRAEFDAAEFPASAPQLTEVQLWQKQMREAKAARVEALKKRKPKTSKAGKKSVAIITEICERVANGEAVSAICEEHKMPSRFSLYDWLANDSVFADMMNKAYATRGEKFAEETTLLADEAREAPPELTAAYRLAVETRRWAAGRLLPSKYGDKVTLAGDNANPIAVKHVAEANELLGKIRGSTS